MVRNIKTYNRYFSFILYSEDEEQMKGMKYITEHFKYARIKHDKDKTEDGDIKKEHYHIVINVGKNPRNRTAIAKEVGIKENYIEGCNKEQMLLYLIHYNNPEKTQYELDEVDGDLSKDLIKIIESKNSTQKEKLEQMLEKIYRDNYNLAQMVEYSIKNNFYEVLKQNQYLITKLIAERNYGNVGKRLEKGTRN